MNAEHEHDFADNFNNSHPCRECGQWPENVVAALRARVEELEQDVKGKEGARQLAVGAADYWRKEAEIQTNAHLKAHRRVEEQRAVVEAAKKARNWWSEHDYAGQGQCQHHGVDADAEEAIVWSELDDAVAALSESKVQVETPSSRHRQSDRTVDLPVGRDFDQAEG